MKKLMLILCVAALCGLQTVPALADKEGVVLTDQAFEQYINSGFLATALNSGDPSSMTDAALQLAEGERILMRPRVGASAEKMLEAAFKFAALAEDAAAMERIKKAAAQLKYQDLIDSFDDLQAAVPSLKCPDPKFSFGDDKNAAQVVNGFVTETQKAVILDSREAIDLIELNAKDAKLPEKVMEELTAFFASAREKTTAVEPVNLAALEGKSRGFGDEGGTSHEDPGIVWDNTSKANKPDMPCEVVSDSGNSFYSWRLKAQFVPDAKGAKVTAIYSGSPLQGRLGIGDIITHLDGIPVYSSYELNNHYKWTQVDTYCFVHGCWERYNIWIQP